MSALKQSNVVPSTDFFKIGSTRVQEQSFKDFYVEIVPSLKNNQLKEITMDSETKYEIDKSTLLNKLEEIATIYDDIDALRRKLPLTMQISYASTTLSDSIKDEIACLKLHTSPTVKISASRIKNLGLI